MDLYRYVPLRNLNTLRHTYHIDLVSGRIKCRFEGKLLESRSNMRALGDHLRYQQSPGYQPFFTVKDKIDDPDRHQASGYSPRDIPMLTCQ